VLPICALCLWIGVRPQPLLETIKPDVNAIAALYADGPETSAIAVRETNAGSVAPAPSVNLGPSNDGQ
jgi:NADH-quinone oxidoreductase subunit M